MDADDEKMSERDISGSGSVSMSPRVYLQSVHYMFCYSSTVPSCHNPLVPALLVSFVRFHFSTGFYDFVYKDYA